MALEFRWPISEAVVRRMGDAGLRDGGNVNSDVWLNECMNAA